MKQLINALIKPKIKTVYVLILTAVIVMMSIHTNGSLNGSELEIIRRLDEAGLSHAQVFNTANKMYTEDLEKLKTVISSFSNKGVSYRTVEYISSEVYNLQNFDIRADGGWSTSDNERHTINGGLTISAVNENTPFEYDIIEGKQYSEIQDGEIILPIGMKTVGDYNIGDTFTTESTFETVIKYFKGDDPKFTQSYCYLYDEPECFGEVTEAAVVSVDLKVVGFSQQRFHDDYLNQSDFDTNVEFFKPDRVEGVAVGLVHESSFNTLLSTTVVDFNDSFDIVNDLVVDLPYYDEDLQWSLDNMGSFIKEEFYDSSNLSSAQWIYLSYKNYSRSVENDLVRKIGQIQQTRDSYGQSGKFRVDSLSSKMDKEPMVTSVLQVLSKYVLMGVLISSFYSFYIHFRNQIRASSKEISALLMQGISWTKVLMAYLLELLVIMLSALLIYLGVSVVVKGLHLSDVLYSSNLKLHSQSIIYSSLYFVALAGVLYLSLYPFRKDVLQKFKKASQTHLPGVRLSKNGLIRELSLKRFAKYIASSIGFAFSIALVVAIIVLSVSSSYHLKNLYSKETFGIQFDYMIRFNDLEQASTVFETTKSYSSMQAQIDKVENVLFMEHNLWDGNSQFYKSSEITFYNEIEDFVPLYSGSYPPHWTAIKGDPPRMTPSALASRRHLDRRDLNKEKGSVESNYLFYYENEESLYENVYQIYGKVNALYNNGWVVSNYQPFYDGDDQPTQIFTHQYVLNLNPDVDAKDFEDLLDSFNVDYLRYEVLIDEFQAMNDAMNETSLLISLTVSVLMFVLLAINIGGLIVSVKHEVADDDIMFKKMGVKLSVINRVNLSVLLLRVLASMFFVALLIVMIYPFYFNDLLGAFGLFSMPGSILMPFTLTLICFIVLISSTVFLVSKRK